MEPLASAASPFPAAQLLEDSLQRMSIAAHQGDMNLMAQEAERGTTVLRDLTGKIPQEAGPCAALRRVLARARNLTPYHQLLLRYAFTAWAADRVEQRRRGLTYDERGRPVRVPPGPAAATFGKRGVI